jgi:hypothetical protein
VVNGGVRISLVETLVANPLIGAEQAYFFSDGFIHESDQGRGADPDVMLKSFLQPLQRKRSAPF